MKGQVRPWCFLKHRSSSSSSIQCVCDDHCASKLGIKHRPNTQRVIAEQGASLAHEPEADAVAVKRNSTPNSALPRLSLASFLVSTDLTATCLFMLFSLSTTSLSLSTFFDVSSSSRMIDNASEVEYLLSASCFCVDDVFVPATRFLYAFLFFSFVFCFSDCPFCYSFLQRSLGWGHSRDPLHAVLFVPPFSFRSRGHMHRPL